MARAVYKSRKTGILYYPVDDKSGVIQNTTPRLAKSITSKYIRMAGSEVVEDLEENHALKLSLSHIQSISYIVRRLAEKKENEIVYSLSKFNEEIATVAIGMDGTCSFVGNSGWRETMVGTISLYNKYGDRLHTIYVAQAPEFGKEQFKLRMTKEIIKTVPSSAKYVGIADGVKDNWTFLKSFVEIEIVDFYHVTEYLAKASKAYNFKNQDKQKEWLESACHVLKNDEYSALAILEEMRELQKKKSLLLCCSISLNTICTLSLMKFIKVSNNCLNSAKKLVTKAIMIKSTNSRATHAKAHLKNCIAIVIR